MRYMLNRAIKYSKNLAIYFGASVVPLLLNLITNPWIAKNLSPRDYAIIGYYQSFSSLISPIIIFYLVHYYIKEFFKLDQQKREHLRAIIAKAVIWFSLLVSCLCFLVLFIYLEWIKQDFEFKIMPYLAFMVFALPLSGLLSLKLADLRMERRSSTYFWITTITGTTIVLTNVLMVVILKWGAFGKLLAPLVANAIIFIIMLVHYRRLLKIKTTVSEFWPIFLFCLPLALSAMLGYFQNGFSTTYLESLGNVNEYGIYNVGVSIGTYLTVFSTAVCNTFQPDIYEATINRRWRSFTKVALLQLSLIGLIVIIFIILAPGIISILTAGRYEASIPYARIIAIGALTSSLYYIINNFSIANGFSKTYLYTTITGSICIITFTPIIVRHWGFYGGAFITVISFIGYFFINLVILGFIRIGIISKRFA